MLGTPFARRALEDVRLSIRAGEAHGLIGATGSGKSTLLQHLNGLMRPQEGTLRVGSYDLTDLKADIAAVRRIVGLVFQMPEVQIFEQYVGDEIAYGPRLAGLHGEDLRKRVRWAMDLVGLDFDSFKDRFTFAISGGEKRKVAVAATLALRPELLLLDEPTAGLDPSSRRELLIRLKQLQDGGMTLMLSSHQMEDVAELSQRLTVMVEGTTVLDGDAATVFGVGDRLENWGLEQPVVARLAHALDVRGWDLQPGIVDQDVLIDVLESRLEPTP
jgi:energy-coupling factor transport system ATP-binding protein